MLTVVGDIDPSLDPSLVRDVNAHSLTVLHGRDESMQRTMKCLEETVTELLRGLRGSK
jgi:hypothetical protein